MRRSHALFQTILLQFGVHHHENLQEDVSRRETRDRADASVDWASFTMILATWLNCRFTLRNPILLPVFSFLRSAKQAYP